MLDNFISIFTEERPEGIIWKKGESFFLVKELPEHHPFYAGIYLGRVKKGFHPSLWLLQWLNKRTGKKVLVDRKGEWMFICGNDVFKRSLRKVARVDRDETVLVVNQHRECLGYGVFQDRKKISVKNSFDIGDFLRRERPEGQPFRKPEVKRWDEKRERPEGQFNNRFDDKPKRRDYPRKKFTKFKRKKKSRKK
ncbi:hypothetical protein HY837_01390 [archaeon]|nr:hypothetical protein [archaeon]